MTLRGRLLRGGLKPQAQASIAAMSTMDERSSIASPKYQCAPLNATARRGYLTLKTSQGMLESQRSELSLIRAGALEFNNLRRVVTLVTELRRNADAS